MLKRRAVKDIEAVKATLKLKQYEFIAIRACKPYKRA
jgi:hypothetical protein